MQNSDPPVKSQIDYAALPPVFDAGVHHRAKIGFVLLATEQTIEDDMMRVSPKFIHDFAASIDRPDAEAVFISCGALRSLEIVDALENKLGKPVVCSNQAMLWDCLRRAGIADQFSGYGRLLRDY